MTEASPTGIGEGLEHDDYPFVYVSPRITAVKQGYSRT